MTLKKFFCNKNLVLNNIKRYKWIIGIQLLLLIILVNFRVLLPYLKYKSYFKYSYYSDLGGYICPMMVIEICMGFFLSLVMFRYMHKKKSNIFIHGLPIKKECIFNSNIISGIIILLIPALLSLSLAILTIVIVEGRNVNVVYIKYILISYLIMFILEITTFIVTSTASCFTGFSISQIIFTIFVFIFFIFFKTLLVINLSTFLFGYPDIYFLGGQNIFRYFTPVYSFFDLLNFVSLANMEYFNGQISNIIYLVIFSLLFYLIGNIAYRLRNVEKCETLLTFKWMKPVLEYICVFIIMLCSIYFTIYKDKSTIIITYFISSFIAYLIIQWGINKKFPNFKELKSYVIYALFILIVSSIFKVYTPYYENKVPNLENIQSAIIWNNYATSSIENDGYKNLSNISNVRNIHNAIIENKNEIISNSKYVCSDVITIDYFLYNKTVIRRCYTIPRNILNNKCSKFTKEIHSTTEYKNMLKTNDIYKETLF